MILKTFVTENFCGIESLTVDLDRLTVLIGENNTGKTSVLEALHICMNRGLSRRATPFSEYDFYLADELTLTFAGTYYGWIKEPSRFLADMELVAHG